MIDLPDFSPLKISQSTGKPGRKQIDAVDHLLVLLPANPESGAFRLLPKAAGFERLFAKSAKQGRKLVTSHIDNKRQTAVTLASVPAGSTFELLTWARTLVAECSRIKSVRIGVLASGLEQATQETALRAVVRAADAAAFRMPTFARKNKKATTIGSLKLLGLDARYPIADFRYGSLGNNLARWLTALPPNKLTASNYRATAQALAKDYGLKFEFIDIAGLKRLGAGAFLAVAQGNANQDAGIIHLSYRPQGATAPALALVGKGILFDTGGNNLKPFKGMLDMHMDMQGSAVALGTALELAAREVPFGFDVWLAVTENRISATAYKSQDVVVAANGTSIQVIHTDAEGRMVLADTLALAAATKPALMIDYATLTGTCVSAITTRYSGVFSNRAGAVRDLLTASAVSGERVWPFPLDDDFDEPLKSETADIKQCAIEGAGDHIFATRFLKRFVPDDIAWVHMDLSAGQHSGGLGAIPTEITGFGVFYSLELLAGDNPKSLAASWPRS